MLDLFEHAVYISGRKVHECRCSNDIKLGCNLAARLSFTGQYQGLPHPFGDGHTTKARRTLDVAILRILHDYLQPLSHRMSLLDSS